MMFEDLWNHRLNAQKSRGQSLTAEIGKIDQKIEQLLDRIVDAGSSSVNNAPTKTASRIWRLKK